MRKKEWLYLIIGIFLIILFITIFLNNKSKNLNNIYNIKFEGIDDNKKSLINILDYCEKEYSNSLNYSKIYNRNDFYNSIRISSNFPSEFIDFIKLSDIDIDKIYDYNSNKLDSLPELIYNGEKIKISNNIELIENNYYLIRYSNSNQDYGCIYIGYLGNNGFNEIEFYCITNDEAQEFLEE